MGEVPSLIKNDVLRSFATKEPVKRVTKESPKIIMPGVKLSNLYVSSGILNC